MSRYIVRYGSMRSLGVMASRGDEPYRRGNEVIVRTPRGLEVGQILCEAAEDALSHLDNPPAGNVIRLVSSDDSNEVNRIDQSRLDKISACQKHIDQLGLEMKLVDIEQLFGGEKIIVFYLAEDRVDFRELVKLLASEFQTRIEMKQIGVRDEAKLLADYGDCGKPVCCNNHLVSMPPVSMKMAKLQKATLDPTKISGRCGRLKCCLRYEFDHYEQSRKAMPRVGEHIVTRNGRGKVIAQRVLLEQLLIETEDRSRIVIDTGEVLSVIKRDPNHNDQSGSSSRSRDASPKRSSDKPDRGTKRSAESSGGADKPKSNQGSTDGSTGSGAGRTDAANQTKDGDTVATPDRSRSNDRGRSNNRGDRARDSKRDRGDRPSGKKKPAKTNDVRDGESKSPNTDGQPSSAGESNRESSGGQSTGAQNQAGKKKRRSRRGGRRNRKRKPGSGNKPGSGGGDNRGGGPDKSTDG